MATKPQKRIATDRGYIRGYFVDVVRDDISDRWRAELWWNPYDGWCVASTRWFRLRRTAKCEGGRVFGPFMERIK